MSIIATLAVLCQSWDCQGVRFLFEEQSGDFLFDPGRLLMPLCLRDALPGDFLH